jgi:hypothetical protein
MLAFIAGEQKFEVSETKKYDFKISKMQSTFTVV